MAFDLDLAERVRKIVKGRKGLDEKPMFGGLCFLRDGKMFAGINSDTLMVRVGKEHHADWASKKGARPMDFTGRPMQGYLFVKPAGLAGAALRPWVEHCWEHVGTVEKAPKRKKKAAPGTVRR